MTLVKINTCKGFAEYLNTTPEKYLNYIINIEKNLNSFSKIH